ncbi:MAG TPA: ATP-dependent helicase, partial [Verrucomicrobiae bacterium]|nr:ATP-dependent helicase [Verrucomicrobiae bacterium]
MAKISVRNTNGHKAGTTKYDAHHKVLAQTYGAFADLRRELSDSKETVGGREDILRSFAVCADSQRSWLLLEDYFEKLSLSRKDFPDSNWWSRLLGARGDSRLEELAFLFLRAKRSVPPELQPHASLEHFAKAEEAEHELKLVQELENWLSPPSMPLLDTPRASLRVVCRPQPDEEDGTRQRLAVQFLLSRPRTGEKARSLHDLIDLVIRATHEQELFAPHDWE